MTDAGHKLERRVCRVRVSMAFLSEMLKGHQIEAGYEMISSFPKDARIMHVLEMPEDIERGGGVATLLVESGDFGPVAHGEVPPEFVPTFTRKKVRK